jgi:hypothetical protein
MCCLLLEEGRRSECMRRMKREKKSREKMEVSELEKDEMGE